MSTAKADILARLRRRPQSAPPPERDFSVLEARQWTHEERIERFITLMNSVHGEVIRTSETTLIQAIIDRLNQSDVHRLLLGRNSPYQDALKAARPDHLSISTYEQPAEQWRAELFHDVDAALTTSLGGIADTGTLMLWSTPDEPRLMSLVPPVHMVVLHAEQLYDTWLDVLRQNQWADGMPTNALLVSGPSKTADIEQTLVFGAHGPRELVTFLVE